MTDTHSPSPAPQVEALLKELKRHRVHIERDDPEDPTSAVVYVACPPDPDGPWVGFDKVRVLLLTQAQEHEQEIAGLMNERLLAVAAVEHDYVQRLATQAQELERLQAWKAEEQQFLIKAAVTLLNAGFKGDGVWEGIEWLEARVSTLLEEGITCTVCGKTVPRSDVYRCADCEMPFHRDCLRNVHFKEQVHPNEHHRLKALELEAASLRARLLQSEQGRADALGDVSDVDTTARELLDNARRQVAELKAANSTLLEAQAQHYCLCGLLATTTRPVLAEGFSLFVCERHAAPAGPVPQRQVVMQEEVSPEGERRFVNAADPVPPHGWHPEKSEK